VSESKDVITNTQNIQLNVRVLAWPDRPGIAKIFVGEDVLFDGDEANVIDVSIKVMVPFHLHFEAPRLGCAWRASGT
jgi:hypothetical protein